MLLQAGQLLLWSLNHSDKYIKGSIMLVSHLKKFIFFKTGRSASTSVEQYFEKYCMAPGEWTAGSPDTAVREVSVTSAGIIGERGPRAGLASWYGGMPATLIKLHLPAETWDTYFKFTTVRNPYDMAVAQYCLSTVWRLGFSLGELSTEIPKFEQWLVDDNLKSSAHAYSVDSIPCFDDVIRYESLLPDMTRICQKFGETFDPAALRSYKSQYRPAELNAMSLFTDIGKEIVKQTCQLELDTFGYTFPTIAYKHTPV
jgi:hypothetical protein